MRYIQWSTHLSTHMEHKRTGTPVGPGRTLTVHVHSTPHTSHFLVDSHLMTRACMAQGSSLECAAHISRHHMRHLHAFMLCVCFSATLPSSSCCLSVLPSMVFSFFFHDVEDKYLRALSLTLPSTTLSQVKIPTTTTFRRTLNCTSRNPQARTGP